MPSQIREPKEGDREDSCYFYPGQATEVGIGTRSGSQPIDAGIGSCRRLAEDRGHKASLDLAEEIWSAGRGADWIVMMLLPKSNQSRP
jgi:hypothetical protein